LQPWERQSGEPLKCYQAFLVYLGLETTLRSIDHAWATAKGRQPDGKRSARAWERWSRKFSWVSRVEARADYLQQLEFEALEVEMRELAVRRQHREIKKQSALERKGDQFEARLDKMLELPAADVELKKYTDTGELISVQRVKGLRGIDLARVAKAWADLETKSIHGWVAITRSIKADGETPQEAADSCGTATFIPTPPPPGLE
jgi:hypothetical protein